MCVQACARRRTGFSSEDGITVRLRIDTVAQRIELRENDRQVGVIWPPKRSRGAAATFVLPDLPRFFSIFLLRKFPSILHSPDPAVPDEAAVELLDGVGW